MWVVALTYFTISGAGYADKKGPRGLCSAGGPSTESRKSPFQSSWTSSEDCPHRCMCFRTNSSSGPSAKNMLPRCIRFPTGMTFRAGKHSSKTNTILESEKRGRTGTAVDKSRAQCLTVCATVIGGSWSSWLSCSIWHSRSFTACEGQGNEVSPVVAPAFNF